MRTGFIHVPVPFVGCTSHESIHRISTSEAMKPWSLMNDYDRPIPRRLVEEAGISRELFARSKKAVEFSLRHEKLQQMMTKQSFQDFTRFCDDPCCFIGRCEKTYRDTM